MTKYHRVASVSLHNIIHTSPKERTRDDLIRGTKRGKATEAIAQHRAVDLSHGIMRSVFK